MGISKITRNFQVTLPKDVRSVVKVKEGDSIIFTFEEDKVVIQKMSEDPVMAAAGIWKNTKETGAGYQKRIREQWKKRMNKNW